MNIVERIEALCNDRGLTIAALERAVDLSNGSIRRWTTNRPSIDKLTKVADFFCVSVDYLLGRTDNPSANLCDEFDAAFFKIMKEAQNDGISPHDLDLALNFLKEARKKDKQFRGNNE